MRNKCIGRQTVAFSSPVRVIASATIAGELEGEGPLGPQFDLVLEDDIWGEKSWEKAERKMFMESVRIALSKAGVEKHEVDVLLGGDLLNQLISANFAARELEIPFLGLYGACSTMAESMLLGSTLIDGGFAMYAACTAVSHFCTAERQYRLPLEMGSQATPTSQRTVTGAGTTLLADASYGGEAEFSNIYITGGVIGRVVDLGITDLSNMGAAMAPAAADTLTAHFADTGKSADDYDLIITGDLGSFGTRLFLELCAEKGAELGEKHLDCGNIVFAPEQNTICGGSGCGCSAVTLNGYLFKRMEAGDFKRALFMATGALMSPTAGMQQDSIPAIAHGVVFERRD